MEKIEVGYLPNVTVRIEIDLSESTKSFLAALLSGVNVQSAKTVELKAEPTNEQLKAEPANEQLKAEPANEQPKAEIKKVEHAEAGYQFVTLEMLQGALAEKVNNHRPAIKEQLNKFASPSLTKLDKSLYKEMYEFLKAL